MDRAHLKQLVALGDRLVEVFGAPQDVEWALVDGDLVLLQARPVTTVIRGVPDGPVYGPGPVAETFPEPLSPSRSTCGSPRCVTAPSRRCGSRGRSRTRRWWTATW